MGKKSLWLSLVVFLGCITRAAYGVPVNDDFTNSILITNLNITLTGSNVGATKETGEPNHAGNVGGASVWWKWIAPTSGPVKLFTFGSTYSVGGGMDTLVAVYTGSAVTNLSLVATNNDQTDPFILDKWSFLTFQATAGTAYHIAVDGAQGVGTGSIVLRVFENNDHLANRTVLSGLSSRSTNWNLSASKELNEKDYRPDDTPGVTNLASKSLWWSWTAPAAAHGKQIKVSTGGALSGSSFDTILTVYTSTSTNVSHSTLTQIRSNNDDASLQATTSFVTFGAASNQTYFINVDGNDGGTGEPDQPVDVGEVILTLAVDNNTYTGRLPLTGTNIQVRTTNLRATKDLGEPVHSPNADDTGGASIWWTWTAPFSGFATINTSGSDFDTVLAVYTNGSSGVGTCVLITSSDDEPTLPFDQNSQVTFLTAAGITYQIAVDGYFGNVGNVDLNLAFTPANVPPVMAPIADRTINEDSNPQTITLTGIGPGGSDETSQTVAIAAFVEDSSLLFDPVVTYANGATTGTLTFTPRPDARGAVGVTVVLTDDGGTANGGINSTTNSFTVTINEINDQPTLAPIASLTVLEDSGTADLILTGISAGGGEFQEVTITASSSSTAIIPHPIISYNSLDAEGTLSFTPATNANGAVTITVIARDDGGTANGGKDAVTNTFTITVLPVNDAPVINALTNLTVNEDSGLRSVSLTGIGTGAANESQALTVQVSVSDTGLLTLGTLTYVSPANTGTLRFTPVTNNFGSATVTVILADSGGTADGGTDSVTNTFLVTVLPVNDRPTLAANSLTNRTLLEDAGLQTVTLTGISAGASNESSQTLNVTVVSSNPTLIPSPAIDYTNGQSSGVLTFATATNLTGTATLSVIVSDDGGTANGGIAAVTNTFSVGVTAVNDPPTHDPLENFVLDETAGGQTFTVNVTGVSEGPANEAAAQSVVSLTVTSSNTGLIPTPSRTFSVGSTTGVINFTPVTNSFGNATLTVVFTDNGGILSGGIATSTNTFRVTVLPSSAASTLAAARTNNINTLSWAATISGWTLQSSTNMTSWTPVGGTPVNIGGRFTVTDTVTGAGKFYRLVKP